MDQIIIEWIRYTDFFDLYDALGREPKLVYVIGETHHCYIGSVGSRHGTGGLAVRYEKQYLDRARAIFGMDKPQHQPAYAGQFVSPIRPDSELVEAIERNIQSLFLKSVGQAAALFKPRGMLKALHWSNQGEIPRFLLGGE